MNLELWDHYWLRNWGYLTIAWGHPLLQQCYLTIALAFHDSASPSEQWKGSIYSVDTPHQGRFQCQVGGTGSHRTQRSIKLKICMLFLEFSISYFWMHDLSIGQLWGHQVSYETFEGRTGRSRRHFTTLVLFQMELGVCVHAFPPPFAALVTTSLYRIPFSMCCI